MEFSIEKFENHTLIKVLEEKLDKDIAPTLKSELMLLSGNSEKNIILDLSNCRYCDGSGLSAILAANRLCKNAEGTFVLSGLNAAVERLFVISQLDNVLNISETIEDAEAIIRLAEFNHSSTPKGLNTVKSENQPPTGTSEVVEKMGSHIPVTNNRKPSQTGFKIEKNENHSLIIIWEENLDENISPMLKTELVKLSENGEKNIILDLSNCNYCNSSGLSSILVANRLCKNAGGILVLSGMKAAVERLLKQSGFDTLIRISTTLDEAESILKGAS